MLNTYKEALNWIHGRLPLGIKPGLKRMEWLMKKLDHPERRLRTVHIAGTNGKGSTVTYMHSILQEAGYEIGTFTSPYIEQFNERISVNGDPVSDEAIIELVEIIRPLADELEKTELGGPSEFEIITAMALYYFAYIRPVDIVLFEVGLGGRLDSTNVIHPLVSIITTIGMDHMQFLGDSIEDIAFEKAGIIKNGVPVISGVKQIAAQEVITRRAKEAKSAVYQFGEQFKTDWQESLPQGELFHFQSVFADMKDLRTGLNGLHQTENAALAVMAILYLRAFYAFNVEEGHIRLGLQAAYWPGRMEQICKQPVILLDGAHNPEGMEALAASLKERYPDKRITALFAGLKDKKLGDMAALLRKAADSVIFTSFNFPRAAGEKDFEPLLSIHQWKEDWKKVISEFEISAKEDEVLVITGSLYFISEVKKQF
ncbi:bifunctional folylpolyglutamate synthase/dihydrofolate synthase [Bacillus aerolatus]|uniref:Dihydrofolate synthase/folylpolyglutamate synthase n=1 Tax=Bacillus aerolatus TaxID=2653354 RepID=A0A6I1FPK1_9BACI|nr:folylpolyglutamate synthase/dihydrofolate synthase family protein [Bacillus aerolatus]KAB7708612.1 bifunctional folylpolyglutamate synthase/dihydrofolate synthase [Bacillus aerolatus]